MPATSQTTTYLAGIASPAILLPRQHRTARHLPPPAEHRLTVLPLPPAAHHRRAKRRNLPPSLSSRERLNRMQMSGSKEVHAPPFSRPMGERGSAHRASVIQIFAYAGNKRAEHGRFVGLARACGWKLLLSWFSSCSFLFPGLEFWRARVDFRRSRFGCLFW